MDGFAAAAALLPGDLRRAAMALPESARSGCEELRLRMGKSAAALACGRELDISAAPVTEEVLRSVLEAATRSSLHAAEEQLRRGFVSAPGGVRVGVCGAAVMEGGAVAGLRAFSSLCLRVPRAAMGCADGIWDALTAGGVPSVLILSPPGGGKTTLLRELVRRVSAAGYRVCAADERGELAGAGSGAPLFDLGPRTDVLTGAPKAEAVQMLLRAMNPQVVAMDEIAGAADVRALLSAAGSGVKLLATAHGVRPEEVMARPLFRALGEAGAFSAWVTVRGEGGARLYETGRFS